MQALLDAIPVPVLTFDRNLRVATSNGAARSLLRAGEFGLKGRALAELFPTLADADPGIYSDSPIACLDGTRSAGEVRACRVTGDLVLIVSPAQAGSDTEPGLLPDFTRRLEGVTLALQEALSLLTTDAPGRESVERADVAVNELAQFVAQNSPPAAAEIVSAAPHAPPGSVLVIEDDEDLALLHCLSLSLEGFAPVAVHTLADAKRALEQQSWSAVLLDVVLPDGSGLELLQILRDSSTPVLVASGKPPADEALRLAWLRKPFGPAELVAKIATSRPLELADARSSIAREEQDPSGMEH